MTNDEKIFDITPRLTKNLAVWPGDTALSREVLCDLSGGDNITLSTLHATVHLGAHADGPKSLRQRRAGNRRARSRVLRRILSGGSSEHCPGDADHAGDVARRDHRAARFIRTGTFSNPENWNGDFAALEVELVDFLHERGVMTVGIDTPSVDLFESKDLPAHKAILRHDMSILEGLVLKDVPEGIYELIALPLRLVGFDASPVRAILRSI